MYFVNIVVVLVYKYANEETFFTCFKSVATHLVCVCVCVCVGGGGGGGKGWERGRVGKDPGKRSLDLLVTFPTNNRKSRV